MEKKPAPDRKFTVRDNDNIFIPSAKTDREFVEAINQVIESNDPEFSVVLPPAPILLQVINHPLNNIRPYDFMDVSQITLDKTTDLKIRDIEDHRYNGSHELSNDMAKDLYKAIHNPVAVFESETSGGLIVFTSKVINGMPLAVVFSTGKKGEGAKLASTFGKTNFEDFAIAQADKGNVIYINPYERIANGDIRKLSRYMDEKNIPYLKPSDVVSLSKRIYNPEKNQVISKTIEALRNDEAAHAIFEYMYDRNIKVDEVALIAATNKKVLIEGFSLQIKDGQALVNNQPIEIKNQLPLELVVKEQVSPKAVSMLKETLDERIKNQRQLRSALYKSETEKANQIKAKLIIGQIDSNGLGVNIDDSLPENEKIKLLQDHLVSERFAMRSAINRHKQKVSDQIHKGFEEKVNQHAIKKMQAGEYTVVNMLDKARVDVEHPNEGNMAIQLATKGNYKTFAPFLTDILPIPKLKNGKNYEPFQETQADIDLFDDRLSTIYKEVKAVQKTKSRIDKEVIPEFSQENSDLLMSKTYFIDKLQNLRTGAGVISNNLIFKEENKGEFRIINRSGLIGNLKQYKNVIITAGGLSAAAIATALKDRSERPDTLIIDAMSHENIVPVISKFSQVSNNTHMTVFSELREVSDYLEKLRNVNVEVAQSPINKSWGHYITDLVKDTGEEVAFDIVTRKINKQLNESHARKKAALFTYDQTRGATNNTQREIVVNRESVNNNQPESTQNRNYNTRTKFI